MTDIVERLREGCGCNFPETTCMAESECADAFAAADEITALRAENERLRAALAFYAAWPQGLSGNMAALMVDAGHRARAALEEKP